MYAFGATVRLPGARELAAVLACGEGAVVSHRSAAAMWGFGSPAADETEVTVVGRCRRSREGLRVCRVRSLSSADRRLKSGIPITATLTHLIDFAAQAGSDELERAIAEAYALGMTSERELRKALSRNPHRNGVGALKAETGSRGRSCVHPLGG